MFIEFFSLRIELVGLTMNLAIIGCPEEIPPNIPPEWFDPSGNKEFIIVATKLLN